MQAALAMYAGFCRERCARWAVIGLMCLAASTANADMFLNGGFESGTTGWTSVVGQWTLSGSNTPVETIVSSTASNWWAYSGDSAVVTGTALTDSRTGGNLRQVFSGSSSFRVGNESAIRHFARLSQTVSSYSGGDIYFAFAAVLEDPDTNHTDPQRPAFKFDVRDETLNQSLYSVAFNSEGTGSGAINWNRGIRNSLNDGYWYYSDWQLIRISTTGRQGNTISMAVATYDCSLGQHGGYAYVDAFQDTAPTPNPGVTTTGGVLTYSAVPEPSSVLLAALGMAGAIAVRGVRRGRSRRPAAPPPSCCGPTPARTNAGRCEPPRGNSCCGRAPSRPRPRRSA
ncbi:MAG: PEP-CTERM sorting domain-containing protein [Planctomycetia bacterium]|nr:PEP-CTERM sorting domain-containing protein [Planctomycetia bacterium]